MAVRELTSSVGVVESLTVVCNHRPQEQVSGNNLPTRGYCPFGLAVQMDPK